MDTFSKLKKKISFDLSLKPEVLSETVSATKRGRATILAGPSALLIDPMFKVLFCFSQFIQNMNLIIFSDFMESAIVANKDYYSVLIRRLLQ